MVPSARCKSIKEPDSSKETTLEEYLMVPLGSSSARASNNNFLWTQRTSCSTLLQITCTAIIYPVWLKRPHFDSNLCDSWVITLDRKEMAVLLIPVVSLFFFFFGRINKFFHDFSNCIGGWDGLIRPWGMVFIIARDSYHCSKDMKVESWNRSLDHENLKLFKCSKKL